jgi:hypothetical protein
MQRGAAAPRGAPRRLEQRSDRIFDASAALQQLLPFFDGAAIVCRYRGGCFSRCCAS